MTMIPAWQLAWVAAVVAPLVAAVAWETFVVPGDPSRSGKAPIAIPGALRLLLELAIFGSSGAGLALGGYWIPVALFACGAVVHHLGTTRRIAWLVRQ